MSTIYDELSNSSDVNQNDPNQEELFTTDTPQPTTKIMRPAMIF